MWSPTAQHSYMAGLRGVPSSPTSLEAKADAIWERGCSFPRPPSTPSHTLLVFPDWLGTGCVSSVFFTKGRGKLASHEITQMTPSEKGNRANDQGGPLDLFLWAKKTKRKFVQSRRQENDKIKGMRLQREHETKAKVKFGVSVVESLEARPEFRFWLCTSSLDEHGRGVYLSKPRLPDSWGPPPRPFPTPRTGRMTMPS